MTIEGRTLGARIRSARLQRGLSQPKLAKRGGLHQKSLSLYERDLSMPSVAAAARIAMALDVDIDDLVPEHLYLGTRLAET